MIKQLLNSVISKYRDFSTSCSPVSCLNRSARHWQITIFYSTSSVIDNYFSFASPVRYLCDFAKKCPPSFRLNTGQFEFFVTLVRVSSQTAVQSQGIFPVGYPVFWLIIIMLLAELGKSDCLVISVMGGKGKFLLLGLDCLETWDRHLVLYVSLSQSVDVFRLIGLFSNPSSSLTDHYPLIPGDAFFSLNSLQSEDKNL